MNKIITLFFLHVCIFLDLQALEPTLAELRSVLSNGMQQLSIHNVKFYCQPYGVVTLEELYNNANTPQECKDFVQKIYREDPTLQYYSERTLKKRQLYHLRFAKSRCILYAQGKYTLSELLLKNGLAFIEDGFNDKEFRYAYQKAQKAARFSKRGIWNYEEASSCIALQ